MSVTENGRAYLPNTCTLGCPIASFLHERVARCLAAELSGRLHDFFIEDNHPKIWKIKSSVSGYFFRLDESEERCGFGHLNSNRKAHASTTLVLLVTAILDGRGSPTPGRRVKGKNCQLTQITPRCS